MSLSPFVKWAGGKEKELKYILPILPERINRYYEPFVGGGAVYLSIHQTDKLFINDKSDELINLYQLIKEGNIIFCDKLRIINSNWIVLEDIVGKYGDNFVGMYKRYSEGDISKLKFDDGLIKFIASHSDEFNQVISTPFNINTANFINEIKRNLISKTTRMKAIEAKKGKLCNVDILDNIEAAFKSAFYMHFRHLYNNIDKYRIDLPHATAIFYFIREYCYSSMFRYNASGGFNVPYGGISYNRKLFSKKIDYLESKELSRHLRKTKIFNLDFQEFLNLHSPSTNDFIFLDPPYDTDFSTYAKNEFTYEDQRRLAKLLYSTDANFMLVIKNTDFILQLYTNRGFNLRTFNKKYLVSFQNRNDKNAKHLIVTNY